MVKTPRTRHSRSTKEPVTIDLAPGEVARMKADNETGQPDGVPAEDAAEAAAASTAAEGEFPNHGEPIAPPSEHTGPDETASTAEPLSASPSASPAGSAHGDDERLSPNHGSQARSGGSGSSLVAGLAGGVLALALAGGLQVAGLLPGGAGGSQPAVDVSAIEARIDQLQGQVAALSQVGGDLSAIAGRVTAAEQGIASFAAELETLRAAMSDGNDAGAAAVDLGPIEERLAALETAITDLGGGETPEAALAALDGQIESLRSEIRTAQEAQAAGMARIDAIEQSIRDLGSRLEEQAEAPGTAVIIAASALKAAIDRGGPFMTELETFASLAPEAPEIAQLRDLAASGVPTRAQIAAESDAAANAMIAAARPVDPEAGLFDRLWGSAMGLVQVRPIGMVEGEGVPEIVARIDAAIASNAYQRAINEFQTLPDAAKSAGEAFMAKVRARHVADALIDQALAAALKA